MNYKDIKDYSERCDKHPDHQGGMISERMIIARLSEEIDELREYIEGILVCGVQVKAKLKDKNT